MRNQGTINIKKIAQLTGVHPSTVSRALNGSERVKQETREWIEKVAHENGYIPDALAKSLIVGKTYTLGIVVPEISNSFYSHIIQEIEDEVSKKGYSIIIAGTNFQHASEKRALDTMLAKRVDALVLCAPSQELLDESVEKLQKIPLVLCDTIKDEPQYDSVYVDEKSGILNAVRYLKKIGHRRIGFIAEEGITQRRMDIFKNALLECGLEVDRELLCVEPKLSAECGYAGMQKMLKVSAPPTAVMGARDNIAIGAMRAIYEAGLKIPGDISIIGYDDIGIAQYLHSMLTTIKQPAGEIGKNVGELVLKKINSQSKINSISKICLIPELVVRESTAEVSTKKS